MWNEMHKKDNELCETIKTKTCVYGTTATSKLTNIYRFDLFGSVGCS